MASSNSATGNEICNVMYKGVQVKCVVGNIISCTLEAITVSCDPTFSLSVGVGKAVRNAGGPNFLANLNAARNAQTGGVIDVDAAGDLKTRKVILVALRSNHRRSMQDVYLQIFAKAVTAGLNSLAIPALGTGAFGLSFNEAANFIRAALQDCPTFGALRTIQFMDLSSNSMNVFAGTIRTLVPSSSSNVAVFNIPSSSLSSSSASSLSTSASSSASGPSVLSIFSISSMLSNSTASSSSSYVAQVSPPKRARVDANGKNKYFEVISDEQLRKHKSEMENSPTNDSLTQLPCSICLGDLISEDSFISESSTKIIEEVVRLSICKHMFHKDCIESAFNVKKQCPNCMKWYSAAVGDQPANATMTIRKIAGTVPGHSEARGWHEIQYNVPSGVQSEGNLRPGVKFHGTTRIAYLPNSVEGTMVLRMLQLAFEQRLIFTIGDSVTTGQKNVVTWNGIHHKTSMSGGTSNYGYPDDDYLQRVQEELGSVGIFKEMLD